MKSYLALAAVICAIGSGATAAPDAAPSPVKPDVQSDATAPAKDASTAGTTQKCHTEKVIPTGSHIAHDQQVCSDSSASGTDATAHLLVTPAHLSPQSGGTMR